jgi:hypothetical protein
VRLGYSFASLAATAEASATGVDAAETFFVAVFFIVTFFGAAFFAAGLEVAAFVGAVFFAVAFAGEAVFFEVALLAVLLTVFFGAAFFAAVFAGAAAFFAAGFLVEAAAFDVAFFAAAFTGVATFFAAAFLAGAACLEAALVAAGFFDAVFAAAFTGAAAFFAAGFVAAVFLAAVFLEAAFIAIACARGVSGFVSSVLTCKLLCTCRLRRVFQTLWLFGSVAGRTAVCFIVKLASHALRGTFRGACPALLRCPKVAVHRPSFCCASPRIENIGRKSVSIREHRFRYSSRGPYMSTKSNHFRTLLVKNF